jgi:hypothetical protein
MTALTQSTPCLFGRNWQQLLNTRASENVAITPKLPSIIELKLSIKKASQKNYGFYFLVLELVLL